MRHTVPVVVLLADLSRPFHAHFAFVICNSSGPIMAQWCGPQKDFGSLDGSCFG